MNAILYVMVAALHAKGVTLECIQPATAVAWRASRVRIPSPLLKQSVGREVSNDPRCLDMRRVENWWQSAEGENGDRLSPQVLSV